MNLFRQTALQIVQEQERRNNYWYQAALKYQGECREWRLATRDVSAARADTDISTPDKFRTAQLDAVTNLLNRIDSLEKLLREVDLTTPGAWDAWLFRRDQLVPKKS